MDINNTLSVTPPLFGRLRRALPSTLFGLLVTTALILGWQQREEYWLQAETGLGYALGIGGLSLMALLMLYPLRKHWRLMRQWLPIRYWFQMHMIFGVLGPLLILFHSNFSHGSINSTIALYAMLLVSGSGLIGRYVYAQIHRGVYGEAIAYDDLLRAFEMSEEGAALIQDEQIAGLKKRISNNGITMLGILKVRWSLGQLKGRESGPLHHRAIARLLRMTRLRFYDRLFSWWHVFHLPIFFMMLITAAVHVVVVHMY